MENIDSGVADRVDVQEWWRSGVVRSGTAEVDVWVM